MMSIESTQERFPSLTAMRAGHQRLLKACADGVTLDTRELVLQFLDAGQSAGAVLQSRADRSAAQGLLDYWVGALWNAAADLVPPEFAAGEGCVLASFDPESAPDLSNRRCPYYGLAAFSEADADLFHGRDEAVAKLVERVQRRQIVIVTGPSGSGKSSLAIAGLIPAIKKTEGRPHWEFLPTIVPGQCPVRLLLTALTPPGENPRSWSEEQAPQALAHPERAAELAAARTGDRPLLLVVDQFEELFTLCEGQDERQAYAAALVALSQARADSRLILTIRSDFLREAGQLSALQKLMTDPEAVFSMPAMTVRELRRVIDLPAAMVGLKFDEGIVDDLVKEVAGEPTALPLLQFTLLRLWEKKERNRISWDVYRRVGSPREALKRAADDVYHRLPQDLDRETARRIFLDLVQPSVGIEFVRRRVRRVVLHRIAAETTVDDVLKRFVDAGLIRMTKGVDSDDDRFEVAHEALLRNWPLLAEWLDNKRQASETEIQLATTARLWRESGRKAGYLLTGDAIADALPYASAAPEIQELVRASQRTELHRTRGKWMAILTVLTVALIAISTALGFTWAARREAVNNLRKLTEANGQLNEALRARDKAQERAKVEAATAISTLTAIASIRPALLLCDNRIDGRAPPDWADALATHEEAVGTVSQSTGLVALTGHPFLRYAGTSFVIGNNVILMPSFAATTFMKRDESGTWGFAPRGTGQSQVSATIEFGGEACDPDSESYRILKLLHLNEDLKIALFETDPLGPDHPPLLRDDDQPNSELAGRSVYTVGYLFRDVRAPESIGQQLLGGIYGVKRLSPGVIRGVTSDSEASMGEGKFQSVSVDAGAVIMHDCLTMGGSAGSPLVDLERGVVIGMHFAGQWKDAKENQAIPMWAILQDEKVEQILHPPPPNPGATSVPIEDK